MKRIQKQAIAHYDKMIEWAEKQPEKCFPYISSMHNELNEIWGSEHCSYCQKYEMDCIKCELQGKYPNPTECCNRLYTAMCKSETWKEWIKKAKQVREYIRVNG